ncbi:MAG TPA: DUF998 domain-containing protein [Acidimicrobiales bacterium]|nr:DUF998 domain-containing protein [Acidimicrobiales bacterium]
MTSRDLFVVTGSITVAGTAASFVALVVLHVLPTGLSPLTNAVSQYGITPYRLGYRVQTIAMGIAAAAAAVGVSRLGLSGGSLVVALLALCGAARLAISWFPMDTPGAPLTETGRRHGLLALAAFGGVTLAALRLGTDVGRSHFWAQAGAPITGLGIAMLILLVSMGAVRRSQSAHRFFGLVERAFYAGTIAFLLVVGFELVRTR